MVHNDEFSQVSDILIAGSTYIAGGTHIIAEWPRCKYAVECVYNSSPEYPFQLGYSDIQ